MVTANTRQSNMQILSDDPKRSLLRSFKRITDIRNRGWY